MSIFEENIINNTVEKLINGEDYRTEIINSINVAFFDFSLNFFKKIINSKIAHQEISIEWYRSIFIDDPDLAVNEFLINAGLNKKTITNIYGTARREVSIKCANENILYLETLLSDIGKDNDLNINIALEHNGIHINLNLIESLIVINALATKKIAIRGGAWSSIGKKIEKPLIDKLCDIAGVPYKNRDNSTFIRDKSLGFDREVDYKLISKEGNIYRVEVKLMGKGNPESADATIARESDIFIADTLSDQNKNQLTSNNTQYIELKDNSQLDILNKFKMIMKLLNIPYNS